ncbi:MAG: rod shape-determining protein MreC [Chloroflexi bacterium]|nr:rod shape-determining protein MreC [Chloroflexota bacterium]
MRRVVALVALIVILGGASALLFQTSPLAQIEAWANQLLTPAQWALAQVSNGVREPLATLNEARDLRQENARLRQQLEQLALVESQAWALQWENQQLRAELGFKANFPELAFLPAEVISFDPLNPIQGVVIDKGSEDAVQPGMTVVTAQGLVGRVTRVGSKAAQVVLATDTTSAVGGVIVSSRARGIVYGQRRPDHLLMRFIPSSEQLTFGDIVMTSGIGGNFPQNIPIGRVVAVRQQEVAMFQEADIEPSVDFTHLQRVLVITNFTPLSLEIEH